MLLPSWIAGRDVPKSLWSAKGSQNVQISVLGDLLYAPMKTLARGGRNFGRMAQEHAQRVVKELLGLDIGAGTDEETRRAFIQAKLRLNAGVPLEKAWPAYYIRRKD